MDKRRIGVVLAMMAAVLLGFGTLSTTWWVSKTDDARIGLSRGEMCVDAGCNEMTVDKLGGPSRYARASTAAYWGGLLACLLLLVTGVARLRPEANTRQLSLLTLVAVVVAALAGIGAVVWFPRMPGLVPAYGMLVFFVGVAFGVGAAGYGLRRPAASAH